VTDKQSIEAGRGKLVAKLLLTYRKIHCSSSLAGEKFSVVSFKAWFPARTKSLSEEESIAL
jgi:hypothetical protein